MSTSASGLQRSIDKTVSHFTQLGLSVNTKKTKVLVFNSGGFGPAKFKQFKFFINGKVLEMTDSYTYLGLIFKPSGSVNFAAKELLTKAKRAYFSMSNVFYENKSMKLDKAIQIFTSLISPIAQYASEFWSVLSLPMKSFDSRDDLMRAWETFIPETLNQQFCRLLLSVQKKTSRLAVLGELGHYPLLVSSFIQTLKYKWSLYLQDSNSLVCDALSDMESFSDSGYDCWLSRVRKMEKLFSVPSFHRFSKKQHVDNIVRKRVKSIFDRFWLDEINSVKADNLGVNRNKLRFYSTLKSSFSREPYLDLVQSRNQRSFLTRLRCSAHHLEIEKLRYSTPPIPASMRLCKFCNSGQIGDEEHFLLNCDLFSIKRACFFGKMTSIMPNFMNMSSSDKLKTMLCPTSTAATKIINKFMRIMFLARDSIEEGACIDDLSYPTLLVNHDYDYTDYDNFSDIDEWDHN